MKIMRSFDLGRNLIMRSARFLLIAVVLAVSVLSASAASVNAIITVSNFTSQAVNILRITVTPYLPGPAYGNRFLTPYLQPYTRANTPSLTNGIVTVNNLIMDYAYTVTIFDGNTNFSAQFFPDSRLIGTNSTIYAANYVSVNVNPNGPYAIPYLPAYSSTIVSNITFSIVGGSGATNVVYTNTAANFITNQILFLNTNYLTAISPLNPTNLSAGTAAINISGNAATATLATNALFAGLATNDIAATNLFNAAGVNMTNLATALTNAALTVGQGNTNLTYLVGAADSNNVANALLTATNYSNVGNSNLMAISTNLYNSSIAAVVGTNTVNLTTTTGLVQIVSVSLTNNTVALSNDVASTGLGNTNLSYLIGAADTNNAAKQALIVSNGVVATNAGTAYGLTVNGATLNGSVIISGTATAANLTINGGIANNLNGIGITNNSFTNMDYNSRVAVTNASALAIAASSTNDYNGAATAAGLVERAAMQATNAIAHTDLTNILNAVGVNATNLATALTNDVATVGLANTNFTLLVGQANTNYSLTVGLGATNDVITASNALTLAMLATNAIAHTDMTNLANADGVARTNLSVTLTNLVYLIGTAGTNNVIAALNTATNAFDPTNSAALARTSATNLFNQASVNATNLSVALSNTIAGVVAGVGIAVQSGTGNNTTLTNLMVLTGKSILVTNILLPPGDLTHGGSFDFQNGVASNANWIAFNSAQSSVNYPTNVVSIYSDRVGPTSYGSLYGGMMNGQPYNEIYDLVWGGAGNDIAGLHTGSTIVGGVNGYIGANYAFIAGGLSNNINLGNYSFASGMNCFISDASTFMWSDFEPGHPQFTSTGTNKFLIQSLNGVGINTNNPGTYALFVNGSLNATNITINYLPVLTGAASTNAFDPTNSAGVVANSATNLYNSAITALIATNNANLASTTNLATALTNTIANVNTTLTNSATAISNLTLYVQFRHGVNTNFLLISGAGSVLANGTNVWQSGTSWTNISGNSFVTNPPGSCTVFVSGVAFYGSSSGYPNGPFTNIAGSAPPPTTAFMPKLLIGAPGIYVTNNYGVDIIAIPAIITNNNQSAITFNTGLTLTGGGTFTAVAGGYMGGVNIGTVSNGNVSASSFSGGRFFGDGGGLTNIVAAVSGITNSPRVYLFTNFTAFIGGLSGSGGYWTNFTSSTTAGIQEVVNMFPYRTNTLGIGCSIQFSPGTFVITNSILVTNYQYWEGAGQLLTTLRYVGSKNIDAVVQMYANPPNAGIGSIGNVSFNAKNLTFSTATNGTFYLLDMTNNESVFEDCAFFGPNVNNELSSNWNTNTPGVIGFHNGGGNFNCFHRCIFGALADGIYTMGDWGRVEDCEFGSISKLNSGTFTNQYAFGDIRHVGAALVIGSGFGDWTFQRNHSLGCHVTVFNAGAQLSTYQDNAVEQCDFDMGEDPGAAASVDSEIGISSAWLAVSDVNYNLSAATTNNAGGILTAILPGSQQWQLWDAGSGVAASIGFVSTPEASSDAGFLDYGNINWDAGGKLHANGNGVTNLPAYTTTSNPTNAFVVGTVYTSPAGNSVIQGSVYLVSAGTGSAAISLWYTNSGKAYQVQMGNGAIADTEQLPFGAIYLPPSSTFSFVGTFGTGASGYVTNAVLWKQP